MIEIRPNRRSRFRVTRLSGRLRGNFANEEAAELQDALWAVWRDQVPVLADQRPKVPPQLLSRLLHKNGSRKLEPTLLAELLRAHPARESDPVVVPENVDGDLLGDAIALYLPKWAKGEAVTAKNGVKSDKTVEHMQEWLNTHVFEIRWERDPDTNHRIRDDDGNRIEHGWGPTALAREPVAGLRPRHFVALLEKMERDGVGQEVQRKVDGFLRQVLAQAALEETYPSELRNRVDAVPAPKQSGIRVVRRPFPPEIVERIRADFLELERIYESGVRRTRRTSVETPAGVPIPTVAGFGQYSADLVETIAYSSARPGEASGLVTCNVAPVEFGDDARWYLNVTQRNRDGVIFSGTKSRPFRDKIVYLLGPLPETLQRLCEGLEPDDLLLPYPGTTRPTTAAEYEYWREKFFAPIARRHGLGPESDDPYALRHVYATLRLAAHHSTFEINKSMGTSLVGSVYGEVQAFYQGKGPLDIDAAIAKARSAAGL